LTCPDDLLPLKVYMNASLSIERSMKDLYGRVRPEVRLLHETYFILDDQELQR
jgi:hypothetical protein